MRRSSAYLVGVALGVLAGLLGAIAFLQPPPAQAQRAVGNFVNATTLTITLGGTAQSLFPQASNRTALIIQNPCSATTQGIAAAESIFLSFTGTAAANNGSIELGPCGSLNLLASFVTQQPVSVFAATTNHALIAMQSQ